jgi:hypothetical protein|tara:strand:- start:45 stop:293 length:249 start_codon:yes stop_codon:yes gene_type:complete
MMTGRKASEATRQKMKLVDKSYMQTEEYRKKVSQARIGKSSEYVKSKRVPIKLNDVVYDSILHAMKETGYHRNKVKKLGNFV